jgi:hypothetical protein
MSYRIRSLGLLEQVHGVNESPYTTDIRKMEKSLATALTQ